MSTPLRLVSPTGVVHASTGATDGASARTACGLHTGSGWSRRLQRPVPKVDCRSCLAAMPWAGKEAPS